MISVDSRSPRSVSRLSAMSGFTLIELLVVVAVIAVLASITFGITRGVNNAQAKAKARGELATIAQALEQFKSTHGDYPWTDGAEDPSIVLSKALLGWKVFDTSSGSANFRDKTVAEVPTDGPKAFVDPSKLDYGGTVPTSGNSMPTNVIFYDPWGTEYVYSYKESTGWDNFGYILYSKGPDGSDAEVGTDGVVTKTIRESAANVDNIYTGE